MIFAPSLASKILDGKKTVTRRRLTHRGGRELRYKVGGVYAIQPGRGKRHIGHIEVRDVIAEPLAFLDEVDAVAEGFRSVEEFYRYWAVLHGNVDRDEIVARIVFELVPGNGCCGDCPNCGHGAHLTVCEAGALPFGATDHVDCGCQRGVA